CQHSYGTPPWTF
nr:immunoglobulin light chain junction region [Macaca mulatta]MOW08622.1 immunoglobulin light chain junction region [Macaca mulatta]MOW08689.1 immunoglobulin light chain junction region [Macaca mulatta]MOW08767.1 immunoglobulin light chain junction region [Macaca mulatta]MOW09050.1 immunoglobulin light chain junction region [Macaca mulatta]